MTEALEASDGTHAQGGPCDCIPCGWIVSSVDRSHFLRLKLTRNSAFVAGVNNTTIQFLYLLQANKGESVEGAPGNVVQGP